MNYKRMLKWIFGVGGIVILLASLGTIPNEETVTLRNFFIGFVTQWIFNRYGDVDLTLLFLLFAALTAFFGLLETLIALKTPTSGLRKALENLTHWYVELSNKQRWIVLGTGVTLSLVPFVGWLGFAWWLIPLFIYLEFHRA